jgi:nitroreductase
LFSGGIKVDVIKAIMERYSARDFKPDPIPKETLVKILETSLHSPSSGNTQPWQIYVAAGKVMENITKGYLERFAKDVPGKPETSGLPMPQNPQVMQDRMKQIISERLKLLKIDPKDEVAMKGYREINGRLFRAPAMVILTMDKNLTLWSAFDFGLLSQTIMLAAESYGVDSIVASAFVSQPDILRQELGIPDTERIVIGIGLGYHNPKSIINTYRAPRRSLQETVIFKGI